MAGNMPDGNETALLNYYLRTTDSGTFTQAPSLWMGLCTATPTDSATNEVPVASNYNRIQVTWNAATTGAAPGPNATATFPSASGSWGTLINGYIICSASTGSSGLLYMAHGVVSPSVAVTTNDIVSFAANACTISLD